MLVDEEGKEKWRLTGFYGEPDLSKRDESWTLMRQLAAQFDKTWLCVGDFNEILWNHEKTESCLRRESQMEAFKNVLEDTGLEDLGFSGPWFTWERGRTTENVVIERLDRSLSTRSWSNMFPEYGVYHLTSSVSNHKPLLISTERKNENRQKSGRKRFHFEAMWTKEKDVM